MSFPSLRNGESLAQDGKAVHSGDSTEKGLCPRICEVSCTNTIRSKYNRTLRWRQRTRLEKKRPACEIRSEMYVYGLSFSVLMGRWLRYYTYPCTYVCRSRETEVHPFIVCPGSFSALFILLLAISSHPSPVCSRHSRRHSNCWPRGPLLPRLRLHTEESVRLLEHSPNQSRRRESYRENIHQKRLTYYQWQLPSQPSNLTRTTGPRALDGLMISHRHGQFGLLYSATGSYGTRRKGRHSVSAPFTRTSTETGGLTR